MFKNKLVLLMASAALGMPISVQAQSVTPTAGGKGGTVSADQIVTRYLTFAGGKENATSLVNGLRSGDNITLSAPGVPEPIFDKVQVGTEEVLVGTERVQTGFAPCPPPNNLLMCPVFTTRPVYEVRPVYELRQVGTKLGAPVTETFSPRPAAPMGFGNVDIALALAEAKHRPNATPSPKKLKGTMLEILGKRAAGEGWGDIAKSYGFELK